MDDQMNDFGPLSMVVAPKVRGKTGPSGEQTSAFRGVTFNKKSNKFQAVLNNSGSHVHLGTFELEVDAAKAFDRAAVMARGPERAKTNFPLTDYLDESGQVVEDPKLRAKIDAAGDPNRNKRKAPGGTPLALEGGPDATGGSRRARMNNQSIEALLALSGNSGFEALLSSHGLATAGSVEGNFFDAIEAIRKKLPREPADAAASQAPPPDILFMIPDPSTRLVGVAFSTPEGGSQLQSCVVDIANGEVLATMPLTQGPGSPHETLASLVQTAGQEKQAAAAAASIAATASSLAASLNQAAFDAGQHGGAGEGPGVTLEAPGSDALNDGAQFNTDAAFHALLAAINANGDAALNLEQHLAILSQLGFATSAVLGGMEVGMEDGVADNVALKQEPLDPQDRQEPPVADPSVDETRTAEEQLEDSRGREEEP